RSANLAAMGYAAGSRNHRCTYRYHVSLAGFIRYTEISVLTGATHLSYRMMCLTAHPDDESGAFGGALLMAHDKGIETSVICLTEGAAGSFRGNATSNEELAALRRSEFAAAGKILGIPHAEVLDYPD